MLVATLLAAASLVITNDSGGNVVKALGYGHELRGRTIMVDGICASACSIMIDQERDHVCVTWNAMIGFHPSDDDPSVLQLYRPELRAWLGRQRQRPILWMSGTQAKRYWRPCTRADWTPDGEGQAMTKRHGQIPTDVTAAPASPANLATIADR